METARGLKISFRPARPEDLIYAKPLIYSAGPELLDYIFSQSGKTPHDMLDNAFPGKLGLLAHVIHTVAELDGKVAGIGAFYDGKMYNRLSIGSFPAIVSTYGIGTIPVMVRSLQSMTLMPPPAKDTMYISDLGVKPEFQSCGIGRALLEYKREEAGKKGYRHFELDVSVNNPRGQALYERLGFKLIREQKMRGNTKGKYVPDTRRMRIVL
jgi:ribosomal protein S18 acetylase RimI-like enzyme